MKGLKGKQIVAQLDKRKGGYCYLRLSAEEVDRLPNKRHTRLLCTINKQFTFPCGLNHLGDGNFFIIVSSKTLKSLGKQPGDTVSYQLEEDPNPLGVAMPEILEVLLAQDPKLNTAFEQLSMGKKRSVIYGTTRLKDPDKQVQMAIKLIRGEVVPGGRKKRS